MDIICAGYPKTGSKSCSKALRELGFKVADYVETAEYLTDIWHKYLFEHSVTIEDVIGNLLIYQLNHYVE